MKPWRQLFRVEHNGAQALIVVCPGWNSRCWVVLQKDKMPSWLLNQQEGYRFFAECDLSTDDVEAFENSIQGFERADSVNEWLTAESDSGRR